MKKKYYQIFILFIYVLFCGYGGKPNNSGTNSSNELITNVASLVFSSEQFSGIITICIPAALAPDTPFGESSNTKHYNTNFIT